jgi:hypothetical protein
MGKDVSGYHSEPRCKICNAKSFAGDNIRDEIDAFASRGATLSETKAYLQKYGINASIITIHNHFKKHSPFVNIAKKLGTAKSRKLRMRINHEFREASSALQRIITAGDKMVENWLNDNDGHQMPVTERLYVEALKEQGRRGSKTSLDLEMEMMDKEIIEGVGNNEKGSKKGTFTESIPKELGVSPA